MAKTSNKFSPEVRALAGSLTAFRLFGKIYYFIPHYKMMILGGFFAAIAHYKDGFSEYDFDLPFLRFGLPIKSKPKRSYGNIPLGASSGFQARQEELDLVSITVIRLAIAIFGQSNHRVFSGLETILQISSSQKHSFKQTLAEALNRVESVDNILNRLKRFQAVNHNLNYSVIMKLFALLACCQQTDNETVLRTINIARKMTISDHEITRIMQNAGIAFTAQ